MHEDSIPDFKFIHPFPDLYDDAGGLMPEDDRGFVDEIPLHRIPATQSAGLDLHHEFARSDLGHRALFQTNIGIGVVHRHLLRPLTFMCLQTWIVLGHNILINSHIRSSLRIDCHLDALALKHGLKSFL